MSDDLKDAFRAVRDRYDGEHPEAEATLNRALFRQRALDRKRHVTRWVVLPIAAAFVASTAWASVTGRLPKAIRDLMEPTRTEHQAPPAASSSSPANVPAPVPVPEPEPQAEPQAEPTPTASVATAAAAQPPAPPSVKPMPATSAAPAAPLATTTASANDPHAALFADAHRIHFVEKDPARAIAAWDAYLAAAPHGRFAPEARYNRALALVRLGRHVEAKRELEAFSNGAFGAYRREEARALLDALARDE